MVVRVRFEFGDADLRAIAAHLGQRGMVNHATVTTWIETVVGASLEDVRHEQDAADDASTSDAR